MIGDTLSAARTRRAVDLEQVEAATGIRVRYLRAIESEDWDALPEEFYARSFIRKYAVFVGADPEPLVEEYRRRRAAAPSGAEAPISPFSGTSSRRAEALRRQRRRQSFYAWASLALIVAGVVVALLILIGGGESNQSGNVAGGGGKTVGGSGRPGANGGGHGTVGKRDGAPASTQASPRFFKPTGVSLKIEPSAEVWACVLGANEYPLVDGQTLVAGETVGPFRSRSFTAAFGNGSVAIWVDGKPTATPSTPSPMGFTVNRHGKVHQLPEGERPSCE